MIALLINFLFVVGGAGIGVTVGWWLRSSTDSGPEAAQNSESPEEKESPKLAQVEGLMARLHQLTTSVAADVGAHSDQVQQINAELTSTEATPESIVATVEKLVSANEKMNEQLHAAEGRLKSQAEEIQSHVHEARTDALTTLFNRRGFDDELEAAVTSSAKSGRPVSLMMMDVDFFKKFNDTYGHQAGDEVLKSVARVVRSNLTDKEVVCRYGGEEFAAIFPGSDAQSAVLGAERARDAVRQEVVNFEGMDLRVTASVGLAELQSDESPADLVKRADQALYASKSAGRNCTHLHDGAMPHPVHADTPAEPAVPPQPEEPEAPPPAVQPVEGISGREEILADVERRIGEWRRGGAPLSLIFMQVDEYERLKEDKGDTAATVVVRAAAQFLKATIRDMDHVARYDESIFALLLPTASAKNAERVAERLRKAVERCILSVDGNEVTFTVSIGVAEVKKGDSRDDLVSRTSKALASSSSQGGNRVQTAPTADAPAAGAGQEDLAVAAAES